MFEHLDSASTARDLNALRTALGEDKLTFSGISYGTLIGEQYAELFPGHIRAIALDSDEDHSIDALAWVTSLSRRRSSRTVSSRAGAGAYRRARRTPATHRPFWIGCTRRAQEGTISVPGFPDNRITPEALIDFVRGELRGVGTWPDLAQNLLAVLNEPAADPKRAAVSGTATSEEATKTAIFCEDHQWSTSSLADLQALRRAMASVAPHTHMSTTGFKDVTGCLGWPHPVANPQHPLTVHNAPPILLVNSRYDVATPYPGALHVTAQIGPSAVLLTYDGTSHVDYPETDCVRRAIDNYLTALATPANTDCPAVFPDFATSTTSTASK